MRRTKLKTLLVFKTEASRVHYCCTNLLKPWHEEILAPAVKDVPPYLIFNMDETMVEYEGKMRVVCVSKSKRALTEYVPVGEHITAVCTVSAAGHKLMPY